MTTSSGATSVPFQFVEVARVFQRRLADLLLFCVTATALLALCVLTPTLGVVGWLYVLQHVLVLVFALTRSEPLITDSSLFSNLSVAVAYVCPYAKVISLYVWPGKVAWPEGGLILVTIAAVFSLICLLTIGKRFGVRPALRALVTRGPYRLVRHPLYLSYVMAGIGFNLQLSNWATLLLLSIGWAAMVYRIHAEERLLSGDPGWRAYAASVLYRLVPGIW